MEPVKNQDHEELPETIRQRIRDANAPRMPAANGVQRTARGQLDEFMATSQRMLEMQRKKVLDAESDYQIARIKLLDGYRVRMENLKYEASEALRDLDQRHREDNADAQALLARLTAMRND